MPRAIQISAFGGPEQMKMVDEAVGDPGPGEIRIRHHGHLPEPAKGIEVVHKQGSNV